MGDLCIAESTMNGEFHYYNTIDLVIVQTGQDIIYSTESNEFFQTVQYLYPCIFIHEIGI